MKAVFRTTAVIPAPDQASIISKAIGNLNAVQRLLGHSEIESTVRELGVDVGNALAHIEV